MLFRGIDINKFTYKVNQYKLKHLLNATKMR